MRVLLMSGICHVLLATCYGADRVPDEALTAWAAYRESLDGRTVTVRQIIDSGDERSLTFNLHGKHALVTMEASLFTSHQGIASIVRNPDYLFVVVKQPDSESWILNGLTVPPPSERETHLGFMVRDNANPAMLPVSIEGHSLEAILEEGWLAVVDMSSTEEEGGVTVELASPSQQSTPHFRVLRCTAEFNDDWLLKKYVADLDHGEGRSATAKLVLGYEAGDSGQTLLTSDYVLEILKEGKPTFEMNDSSSYRIERHMLSDQDFRLPAFGFPEPSSGGIARPWLFVLVLLAVVGFLLSWMLRRRST